jgi:hypothetical protein
MRRERGNIFLRFLPSPQTENIKIKNPWNYSQGFLLIMD